MKLFLIQMVLCCLLLASCQINENPSEYHPDLSGLKQDFQLIPFHQEFFNMNPDNISQEIEQLKKKYPSFTVGYIQSVIGIRDSSKEAEILLDYLSYPDTRYTYDTICKVFKDLSSVESALESMALHFKYYFPEMKPIEKAFTYLSDYHGDRLAVLEEGFVGIPLDMYLGAEFPTYSYIGIPNYDQRTCNFEHIAPKAALAIAENICMSKLSMEGNRLIDKMIYNGKIFYIIDLLLPGIADSLKFGFSSYQMDYCSKGEKELYKHLVEEKLIFSRSQKDYSKFINRGPFNPILGLPGNSGSWLGFKMVSAYATNMRKKLSSTISHKNAASLDKEILNNILEESNTQKFLNLYKPT